MLRKSNPLRRITFFAIGMLASALKAKPHWTTSGKVEVYRHFSTNRSRLLTDMTLSISVLRRFVPIAVVLAGTAHAQWKHHTVEGNPVAAIGLRDGVQASVACYTNGGPRYVLAFTGPANGLAAGEGVRGQIEGREKVALRFWRITVDARGMARLVAYGGSRGSTGRQSSALYALESMRTSKNAITVSSGKFRITIPAEGIADAMTPLVARCGDIKQLARRAEGREGAFPQ